MEEELEIVESACGTETCHFSMSGFCPEGTCALRLPVQQSLEWLAKSAAAKALAKQIGPGAEDFFYVHDCTVVMNPEERGWAAYYQECWFPFTDDDYVESLEQTVNKLRAAVADSIQHLHVTAGVKEALRGLTIYHFFLLRFKEGMEDARICVVVNAPNAEDLEEGLLKTSFRLHLVVGLAFWAGRCSLSRQAWPDSREWKRKKAAGKLREERVVKEGQL